jgi:hypothetical protein
LELLLEYGVWFLVGKYKRRHINDDNQHHQRSSLVWSQAKKKALPMLERLSIFKKYTSVRVILLMLTLL